MRERVVQHGLLEAPFVVSRGEGEKGLLATCKLEHRRTRIGTTLSILRRTGQRRVPCSPVTVEKMSVRRRFGRTAARPRGTRAGSPARAPAPGAGGRTGPGAYLGDRTNWVHRRRAISFSVDSL